MMSPRHVSELLPGALNGIITNDQQGAQREAPKAVRSRNNRAVQPGRTARSTNENTGAPAGDGRDSHQDRVATAQLTKVDTGILIELPFPPSVNHYWGTRVFGNSKRKLIQRYISEAGQKFKRDVHQYFLVENITARLGGPLACTVDLFPPCNRRRDCDNYCKGLLDALGSAGLYDDDSQIIDLHIRMHPKRAPGSVRVTLTPVIGVQTQHNQLALSTE